MAAHLTTTQVVELLVGCIAVRHTIRDQTNQLRQSRRIRLARLVQTLWGIIDPMIRAHVVEPERIPIIRQATLRHGLRGVLRRHTFPDVDVLSVYWTAILHRSL